MTPRRACAAWRDSAAGPLVRPYAMTRGRTRAADSALRRGTMVVAADRPTARRTGGTAREPAELPEWSADHDRILRICRTPAAVGDLANQLEIPLMVAGVLVTDLLDTGRLEIPLSPVREPDQALLQAVLDGIKRL